MLIGMFLLTLHLHYVLVTADSSLQNAISIYQQRDFDLRCDFTESIFDATAYSSVHGKQILSNSKESWAVLVQDLDLMQQMLSSELPSAFKSFLQYSRPSRDQHQIFLYRIIDIQSQFTEASSRISSLQSLYRHNRMMYHKQNASAFKTYQDLNLTEDERWILRGGHELFAFLGKNQIRKRWDAYKSAKRAFDEAAKCVEAFESDISLLKSIAGIVQEINHHFDSLAFALYRGFVGNCDDCMFRVHAILQKPVLRSTACA